MTHLFSTIRRLIQHRPHVPVRLVGAVAIVIILGSWQAYGLFVPSRDDTGTVNTPDTGLGSTDKQQTDGKTPATEGQTNDDPTKPASPKPGSNTSTSTGNGNSSSGGSTQSGGGNSSNPGGSSGIARNYLGVPLSATVLTLSGLNYNLYNNMPQKFQGIFSRAPYNMIKVEYPASLASDSITRGVSALNAELRAISGHKIVLAQSQGAQVASRWMRQYANDATAPGSGDITFILTGNPLRSTGGYIIGRTEVGGTTGQPTPTNTKWPIIDVARRYDGWADWVNNQSNQWAVDNANAGKTKMHNDYQSINLYASTNTIWKSGNTTYVLTKEDTLPLWDNNDDYPLGVRSAMRAHIERAYNRPSNDPKTVVLPIETPEWEAQLRDWGVPY